MGTPSPRKCLKCSLKRSTKMSGFSYAKEEDAACSGVYGVLRGIFGGQGRVKNGGSQKFSATAANLIGTDGYVFHYNRCVVVSAGSCPTRRRIGANRAQSGA